MEGVRRRSLLFSKLSYHVFLQNALGGAKIGPVPPSP